MPRQVIQLSNPLPTPFYGTVLTTGRRRVFDTSMIATQIVGLVPVGRPTDCRPAECYCVPVFPTDRNSFLFESLVPVVFRLERYNPEAVTGVDMSRERAYRPVGEFCVQAGQVYPPYMGEPSRFFGWEDLGPFSYGQVFPFGSLPGQPYYSGLRVEWEQVMAAFGPGFYRIAVGPYQGSQTLYSDCFALQAFDCEAANGTVYVQAFLNHTVGDITNQQREFYLNGLNWEDSNRYPGRLSAESPTYEDTTYFLATGKIVSEERLHRSRAVQRYNLQLFNVPLSHVLRLFAYGAVKAFVTDFNTPTTGQYKALPLFRSGAPEISNEYETVTGLIVKATLPMRHQSDNNLLASY